MQKNKISTNYIMNLAYQIMAILIPLVTTPYISRVLGAGNIGIYSYTTSIVTYFSLAAVLGSSSYGQREIAYNRDNKLERSRVFWEVILLRLITSLICIIAYLFFVLVFCTEYKDIFLIQTLVIIGVIFDIGWMFSGLENFKLLVFRNVVIKLLGLGYIFMTVKSQRDLALYVTGVLGINLLGFISLWPAIRKYVCYIPLRTLRPLRHLKTIVLLFLPTIAIQVYTVLDKTMIGVLTRDTIQNGYYEQAEKICKLLLTILTSMGAVLAPRIAYLYSSKRNEDIALYLKKSFQFVFMLAMPMCVGLIVTSEQIVPWFFGDGYEGVIPLLHIFSILILAIGMSNVSGTQYLISVGREKEYTKSVVSGACVNLLLNIILIAKYQAIGAAIASVLAEVTVAATQLFFIRREVNLQLILRSVYKYIVASFAMGVVCAIVKQRIGYSFVAFLITVLLGSLLYFGLLFVMRDAFVHELFKRVMKIGREKKNV